MKTTLSSRVDVPRLQLTFSCEALSWILERLRQRLQQGKPLEGVLTLQNATGAQRDAVDRLLGRSPTNGTSLSVRLEELEAMLQRAEICDTLADAVNALLGPVANLRLARQEIAAQWQQLFDGECQRTNDDFLRQKWLANIQSTGLLRRLSKDNLGVAGQLLREASRVLDTLPCKATPLAECAANVLGDSHALDLGSPVATLVLRAFCDEGSAEVGCDFETRRDAWAAVGVMLDELSGPVLILNLRAESDSLTGQSLNLHATAGEPCRITTRQFLRHPPRFTPFVVGNIVYVCENPTVIAAAANRLGSHSAPLICIEGQPKTAARLLLSKLTAAGIKLFYHGDFDWSGIQIANLVMKRHGAVPWRFNSASYRRSRGSKKLVGQPVPASWDADLMTAMVKAGEAVDEERVLDDLFIDLVGEQSS